MTELEKQINLVVEAREKSRLLSEERKSMYDAFISQHTGFFADVAAAVGEVGAAEDELRKLALVAFKETGDKQVAPGIGIRVRQVLVYEPKEAMDWAIKHELALKLDVSNFEKIAKTSKLLFVRITEEPTATIATELQVIE